MPLGRRVFLLSGGAALASPASNAIGLGVIGSGGRGTLVMTHFQEDPVVRVAALCDVYEPNLENALSVATKAGHAPRPYRDYRRVLDDSEIDAVLIATPEHWHHRMVLDALAAGKDVYVEKPLCQTPEQGVELVEAERTSNRVVQVGMQRRSYDLFLEGRKLVADGTLGNVRMVRSWWLNNYLGGRRVTALSGSLDWDQWLGPAPRRPFDPDRFRKLETIQGLCGRHNSRPGRAHLRRHPDADEFGGAGGRHGSGREAAQRRGRYA